MVLKCENRLLLLHLCNNFLSHKSYCFCLFVKSITLCFLFCSPLISLHFFAVCCTWASTDAADARTCTAAVGFGVSNSQKLHNHNHNHISLRANLAASHCTTDADGSNAISHCMWGIYNIPLFMQFYEKEEKLMLHKWSEATGSCYSDFVRGPEWKWPFPVLLCVGVLVAGRNAAKNWRRQTGVAFHLSAASQRYSSLLNNSLLNGPCYTQRERKGSLSSYHRANLWN